jgi:anthranilate phosphoribosyltransferase
MKAFLVKVMAGAALEESEASDAMSVIMDGEATPAQIGALLGAIAARGETEDEVVGFARVMRARAKRVKSEGAIDTCGTGGDGAGTLNISTLASLVVAACGVPVAKHGNRSASGSCGSADVLEALGVKLDPSLEVVQRCLDESGWTFLFAPAFHASTRHAVGPRKELGVRTAFNLLGPLTNPAFPEAQVVGVPRPELTGFLARCLARLGVRRAWVVHGAGLDEMSLMGITQVAAFDDGGAPRSFSVRPEDAGLSPCEPDALRGGDPARSAQLAAELLDGARGPARDVVVLNAAAALVVAGRAPDLPSGVEEAGDALDSGRAARLLARVKEICGT